MRHRYFVSLAALVAAVSMTGQNPAPATKSGPAKAPPAKATPVKANQAKSTGTAKAAPPPRTPWNDPDLQGTWFVMADVPLERSAANANKEFLTDEEVAAA